MSLMTDPMLVYSVLLPVVAVAGILRGAMGFGGPLVMVLFLNVFFPPAISVAIVMWIDLCSNLRLIPDAYRDSSRAVVIPLSLGTLLAMPGAYLLMSVDPVVMKRAIVPRFWRPPCFCYGGGVIGGRPAPLFTSPWGR